MWKLCELAKEECGHSKVVDNIGLGVMTVKETLRRRGLCPRTIGAVPVE